ncbi:signal peptidase I [Candidatus Woesearchaeota archaeon]|nr:signal peptidase I [Candidatus Woesearchaeota archaeon]
MTIHEINDSNCYSIVEKEIRGSSMQPLYKDGETLKLMQGYYDCNPINRGDLVALNISGDVPLIKRIVALPSDNIEIINSSLTINGQTLTNSENREYILAPNQAKMIGLYIKNNTLVPEAYIIFGDNLVSSRDSRIFGGVAKKSILGKFVESSTNS